MKFFKIFVDEDAPYNESLGNLISSTNEEKENEIMMIDGDFEDEYRKMIYLFKETKKDNKDVEKMEKMFFFRIFNTIRFSSIRGMFGVRDTIGKNK